MYDNKIRVTSDRYDQKIEEMGEMGGRIIPVDLYGKRVTKTKTDPNNLSNIAEDIKEYYDLTGEAGMK